MDKRQIHIIAETTHWLAANKPAGLNTERTRSDVPSLEANAEHWLKSYSRRQHPFLGIVHRLDRVTSGILVMAKKKSALKNLNEQFRTRQVDKIYLAIVNQLPPNRSGHLNNYLKKDTRLKQAIIYQQPEAGTFPVSLDYKVLDTNYQGEYLLQIQPHTGKYHQIRAQLASIGCPIKGDNLYGSAHPYQPNCIALHAHSLTFIDPQTSEQQTLVATPPFGAPSNSGDG